ncbi:hypothetical protein BC351_29020 [Paenibacillus ferrarius]|uniref:Uncharacterized protein n=1 Tax=Paenibacillus ferrarius TaxID=1469647 RepID=A0A1V4HI18_9BACL|nr:hypothetical protein BC351_29020 [Paenibacillus ferrarius]
MRLFAFSIQDSVNFAKKPLAVRASEFGSAVENGLQRAFSAYAKTVKPTILVSCSKRFAQSTMEL